MMKTFRELFENLAGLSHKLHLFALAWRNRRDLHLELNFTPPVSIYSRTAQRCLKILGLRLGRFLKSLFTDWYERAACQPI